MVTYKIKGQEEKYSVIELELSKNSDDEVTLHACNFISGNICTLTRDGKLRLRRGISSRIGLQLDGASRIMVERD